MIRRWAVVWLSIILFGCPNRSQRSSPSTADNVIQRENRLEGDFDWASGVDPDAQQLSAFADRAWSRAGTTVNLKVSAEANAAASWVLYRLGWYSGAGARRIATGDAFPIQQQPSCAMHADTGMVHCEWPTSAEVFIPPEAVSGLYVIKILRNNGFVRFVPLAIVDDRRADFVIQANINTWQAYNTWGGASLYTDQTGTLPLGRAVKVSFDRPYAMGRGAGHMFDWEAPFARFVESIGYDVTYTANSAVHAFGAGHLQRAHGVLFAGHDEYWTGEQRDAVELANQNGTALLFFGANQAYWKVRYEEAFDPSNPRVLTCYRVASLDPLQGRDVTVHFRDPQVNRPENALLGIMYE